jgi:hypothetical protein
MLTPNYSYEGVNFSGGTGGAPAYAWQKPQLIDFQNLGVDSLNNIGYAGESLTPGVNNINPSQPFDWLAAAAGGTDLLEGIGNFARSLRGESVRPAGSRLAEYLRGKQEDSYLKNLLKELTQKRTSGGSSPELNPLTLALREL